MRILITGATGFVGQHLCSMALAKKISLLATIRLPVDRAKLPPEIDTLLLDSITAPFASQDLEGIDTVIHLAARAHILDDRAANPEAEFFKINVNGTINLAQAALQAGVRHFIFISSMGTMATTATAILTEASPCHPDTPYGKSKLAAEQELIQLCQNTPMAWTIIRPTLVYGRGNPGNMERLIKLIDSGLPLPIGSIQNRRSFTYVENLVDAIITCTTHPHAKNQTFLIADKEEVSTPQLAQEIAKNLNKPCRLLPVPPLALAWGGKLGDWIGKLTNRPIPLNSNIVQRLSGSLWVDISHIQNSLNWEPPYSVSEGLQQTLKKPD